MPSAASAGLAPDRASVGYWRGVAGRMYRNRLGMAGGALLAALCAAAVLAPLASGLVTHYGPLQQNLLAQFEQPSTRHWLGTDEVGRDTLTRLLWGSQISIGVALFTVALQLLIGGGVGIAAGYFGGWVDECLMRAVDAVLAIPAIFLFILMSILLRPGPMGLAAIIAFATWGTTARLVRGEVIALKHRDFIVAAQAVGASTPRLLLRHVLPNVLPVMMVAASLGVGSVILTEAALDFLGLGISPPAPSWGNMLANAQVYFRHSIYLVVFPGALIFVTVLAANVLGNALRDALDPSLNQTA